MDKLTEFKTPNRTEPKLFDQKRKHNNMSSKILWIFIQTELEQN